MNSASAPGLESGSPKSDAKPIVFVVDDDISVRESLELLIRFAGWQPETFDDDVLLSAIRHAIERSVAALSDVTEIQVLRDCYASLTPREREAMTLVVSGLLN